MEGYMLTLLRMGAWTVRGTKEPYVWPKPSEEGIVVLGKAGKKRQGPLSLVAHICPK